MSNNVPPNLPFNIRKFNPDCLTQGGVTVAILGKRATGKTRLITQDLLPRIGSICGDRKIVVNPTAHFDNSYQKIVDPQMIHDSLTADLLEQVVDNTRQLCRQNNYRNYRNSQTLLVMDDCLIDHRITNDRNLRMLFMNGRHLRMNMIITQQFPGGLSPQFRANIDYVFIFQENNPQTRQRLYNYYAGMFPTFGMFCQALDVCTNNYGCMVIDNVTRSDRLEGQVFWYQAQDFNPRIGAVTVIANKWRQVQAKRQLARLRIGFELKLLPGIGIKYQEAAERFAHHQDCENF